MLPAMTKTDTTKILQIYVLPTLRGSYTIHPRFLKPRTKVEHGALFTSFVLRKWRYHISDAFGSPWHAFGQEAHQSGSYLKHVYNFGNRITTRRAGAEYFFKMIPERTEGVEIIYPAGVDESRLRRQIGTWLEGALYSQQIHQHSEERCLDGRYSYLPTFTLPSSSCWRLMPCSVTMFSV
jgi:hypothetical protein